MATRPKTTVLADDTSVDKPQTTSPGDAPADTFNPTELASSVTPNKEAAAEAGYLAVNAVVPVESPYVTAPAGAARTEQVYAYDEKGERVTLDRDIVTGATTVDGG